MSDRRVRGEVGPACRKCGGTKTWSGTRWLCRPCHATANSARRASLDAEKREAERVRANELRNLRQANWTPEQRERARLQVAAWRAANPERHRKNARDWYAANSERARAKKLADYRANPGAFMARNLVRKARLRGAVCPHGQGCVSTAFLDGVYADRCTYCGAPASHADHFYPLARGGLHCVQNIVPACETCNARKGSRDPEEWLRSLST